MIYFAYDVTMDEQEMRNPELAPGAILAGNGYLINRRLVFTGEGGRTPVAVPHYGDRVYGVLYFISDPGEVEALKRLRAPIPRRVTRVRTLPHHRIVFAVTFESDPENPFPEGAVDSEYRNRLVEIARLRGFPSEYTAFLETLPVSGDAVSIHHGD